MIEVVAVVGKCGEETEETEEREMGERGGDEVLLTLCRALAGGASPGAASAGATNSA